MRKKVKMMSVSYNGGFLTKAKGDDDKLAFVKFNNGTTKPMKRAKKRCLSDADKLQKSLHHPPSAEEWVKRPDLFSLETIEDLFGSYSAMLEELAKQKQPRPRKRVEVKVTKLAEEQHAILKQEIIEDPNSKKSIWKPMWKVVKEMPKKQQIWSEEDLAKNLHEACGGKDYITMGEYNIWRARCEQKVPVNASIAQRLGGGKWANAFPKMRELLGLEPEEATVPELDSGPAPMPEPEVVECEPKTAMPAELEPITSEPEIIATNATRSDEQCLEDLRKVATKVSGPLSREKYNELREEGMLSASALYNRFSDHRWADILVAAGLKPSAAATKSRRRAKASMASDVLVGIPSYRFVNLLDCDYKISMGQSAVSLKASDATLMVKIQDTLELDNQGGGPSKTTEAQFFLKRSDQVFDLPEPEPGTFYLVGHKLYDAIPASIRRSDLVPVYQIEYTEAHPLGVYVTKS